MRRTLSGAKRAAIGSTLLRSPGSSNPAQYAFNGALRSACPAAFAKPSVYAAKRLSCGLGSAEVRGGTGVRTDQASARIPTILATRNSKSKRRVGAGVPDAQHPEAVCGVASLRRGSRNDFRSKLRCARLLRPKWRAGLRLPPAPRRGWCSSGSSPVESAWARCRHPQPAPTLTGMAEEHLSGGFQPGVSRSQLRK